MHENFVKLAKKLIAKNGRTIQLVSTVKGGDRFNPTEQKVTVSAKGVQSAFRSSEIDGDTVHAQDKLFLFDNSVAITVSMRLLDNGKDYSIIRVSPVAPGETTVLYKVQARL